MTIIKVSILTISLLLSMKCSMAQSTVENEIRRLDQLEAQATISGDTITLKKLWSPGFVVNNPANMVVNVAQIRQLMKEGKISYTTFNRIIEKVTITGPVAVAMGYEENEPEKATDNAGKKVTRRYTNVWLKEKAGWKIIARQATIIDVK
ncbi:nuclear transport factor 2 family protein [Mucilaginibacter pallidiroseus]|uniref:Nuclear transport factor 2 family protein n=1 Tax=Mucilaginibacter pallidiroseus TaxID=2599295 RepID=A0A563UBY3_9SPHI|nr:nuclear transport factor 2 family protein [Mucilaginibacter pallidiroseus]TWR28888.1 nuclear transport factor 2 family protein [Mucilaginibacter pallidiroseus]